MEHWVAIAVVLLVLLICATQPTPPKRAEPYYTGSVWPHAPDFPLYGQPMALPMGGAMDTTKRAPRTGVLPAYHVPGSAQSPYGKIISADGDVGKWQVGMVRAGPEYQVQFVADHPTISYERGY